MKLLSSLLLLCFLSFSFVLAPNAEIPHAACDDIHDYPEKMASYPGDIPALMKYYKQNLSPVLLTCKQEEGSTVKSMQLELVINQAGMVESVKFPDLKATDACKDKIRDVLLRMNGWSPAEIKGKPVCSRFYWPIYGIKWSSSTVK